jgi:ribosomal protein S18 acetylase RimI-like enzyme
MQIRQATREDLPALMELWKEFMDHHRARDSHYTRTDEGHLRWADWLGKNLDSPDWRLLVAEEGGIVGYCLAFLNEYPPVFTTTRYGFVQDLAVTGEQRGRGVGRRLYGAAEAWFRERGVDRVELDVATSNPDAAAFWRRMGCGPFQERLFKRI